MDQDFLDRQYILLTFSNFRFIILSPVSKVLFLTDAVKIKCKDF